MIEQGFFCKRKRYANKLLALVIAIGLLLSFQKIEAQEEKEIKSELVDTVSFTNRANMQAHEMSFTRKDGNKFGVEDLCADPQKATPENTAALGAHMTWGRLNLSRGTSAIFKVNTPNPGTYKLELLINGITYLRDLVIKCNGKNVGVIIACDIIPEDWPSDKVFVVTKEFEFKVSSGGKTVVDINGAGRSEGPYLDTLKVYRLF